MLRVQFIDSEVKSVPLFASNPQDNISFCIWIIWVSRLIVSALAVCASGMLYCSKLGVWSSRLFLPGLILSGHIMWLCDGYMFHLQPISQSHHPSTCVSASLLCLGVVVSGSSPVCFVCLLFNLALWFGLEGARGDGGHEFMCVVRFIALTFLKQ